MSEDNERLKEQVKSRDRDIGLEIKKRKEEIRK